MTGYHISVGYNSCHPSASTEVQDKLREVVNSICAKPEMILAEVERVESRSVPSSYADSYRKPWQDATIKFINNDQGFQVMQLASGGDSKRDDKESMRRAFCRLVIEAMHREKMEVNLTVA